MNQEILNKCRILLENFPINLNYITPDELYSSIQTNPNEYFVIDNRDIQSFNKGHIPNSTNIYIKEFLSEENLNLLPKDKTIVLCCWVGHTASQIMTMLQLLGFKVLTLKFGMGESAIKGEKIEGWETKGYPIVKTI